MRLPFAVFAFPGEDGYYFLSSTPDEDTGECELCDLSPDKLWMEVSMFGGDNPYVIGVADMFTAEDVMKMHSSRVKFPDAEIHPVGRSTPHILYDAQIHQLVKSLKPFNKVVLSRLIAGEVGDCDLRAVVTSYFGVLPSTFRFLYFTQETGLWMGASPELLFDYDYESGRYVTMSLAGTRPRTSRGEWDDKNIEEQEIVTRTIIATLNESGAKVDRVAETIDLPFGALRHRCTIIEGAYHGDIHQLLSRLSPTPAVAGYPRDKAYEAIERLEAHSRHCYAGYVAVNDPGTGHLTAYVNLRSVFMQLDDNKLIYNIYAGGGITNKSEADLEWVETEGKAALLQSILQNNPVTINNR